MWWEGQRQHLYFLKQLRTSEEDRSCRIFYALMLPRAFCPHGRPHHLVRQLLLSGPEELTQRAVAAAQRTIGGDLNSLEDVYNRHCRRKGAAHNKLHFPPKLWRFLSAETSRRCLKVSTERLRRSAFLGLLNSLYLTA